MAERLTLGDVLRKMPDVFVPAHLNDVMRCLNVFISAQRPTSAAPLGAIDDGPDARPDPFFGTDTILTTPLHLWTDQQLKAFEDHLNACTLDAPKLVFHELSNAGLFDNLHPDVIWRRLCRTLPRDDVPVAIRARDAYMDRLLFHAKRGSTYAGLLLKRACTRIHAGAGAWSVNQAIANYAQTQLMRKAQRAISERHEELHIVAGFVASQFGLVLTQKSDLYDLAAICLAITIQHHCQIDLRNHKEELSLLSDLLGFSFIFTDHAIESYTASAILSYIQPQLAELYCADVSFAVRQQKLKAFTHTSAFAARVFLKMSLILEKKANTHWLTVGSHAVVNKVARLENDYKNFRISVNDVFHARRRSKLPDYRFTGAAGNGSRWNLFGVTMRSPTATSTHFCKADFVDGGGAAGPIFAGLPQAEIDSLFPFFSKVDYACLHYDYIDSIRTQVSADLADESSLASKYVNLSRPTTYIKAAAVLAAIECLTVGMLDKFIEDAKFRTEHRSFANYDISPEAFVDIYLEARMNAKGVPVKGRGIQRLVNAYRAMVPSKNFHIFCEKAGELSLPGKAKVAVIPSLVAQYQKDGTFEACLRDLVREGVLEMEAKGGRRAIRRKAKTSKGEKVRVSKKGEYDGDFALQTDEQYDDQRRRDMQDEVDREADADRMFGRVGEEAFVDGVNARPVGTVPYVGRLHTIAPDGSNSVVNISLCKSGSLCVALTTLDAFFRPEETRGNITSEMVRDRISKSKMYWFVPNNKGTQIPYTPTHFSVNYRSVGGVTVGAVYLYDNSHQHGENIKGAYAASKSYATPLLSNSYIRDASALTYYGTQPLGDVVISSTATNVVQTNMGAEFMSHNVNTDQGSCGSIFVDDRFCVKGLHVGFVEFNKSSVENLMFKVKFDALDAATSFGVNIKLERLEDVLELVESKFSENLNGRGAHSSQFQQVQSPNTSAGVVAPSATAGPVI